MTKQLPYIAEAIGTVPLFSRRHYGSVHPIGSRTARSTFLTTVSTRLSRLRDWQDKDVIRIKKS